jgi:hypothetical protein
MCLIFQSYSDSTLSFSSSYQLCNCRGFCNSTNGKSVLLYCGHVIDTIGCPRDTLQRAVDLCRKAVFLRTVCFSISLVAIFNQLLVLPVLTQPVLYFWLTLWAKRKLLSIKQSIVTLLVLSFFLLLIQHQR